MRPGSDTLKEVLLSGSFSTRLIVDAFNDDGRTVQDLAVDTFELRWDREADLKSAGTLHVVQTTDDGSSLSPKDVTDPLAPFGPEVNILMEISADDAVFSETVQIGHYRIAVVPSASDEYADVTDGQIVTSSSVDLTLEDRLSGPQRRGFRSEENPATTSGWDELARISGMQVERTDGLADVVIPDDYVYQAVRGGRLKAIRALADMLGGTEYTTPDGALSVMPYEAGDPIGTLALGENGTILGDDGGMDSTDVYNVVVGDFQTVDQIPIHKVAVAAGLLEPTGPYDENTYYHSNPAITTEAAAEIEVAAVLAQVSSPKTYRITVQCIINPLVEDGDVYYVQRRDGSTITGQVVSHKFGGSMLMTVEMDVLDAGVE